jgi:hypothetical protein
LIYLNMAGTHMIVVNSAKAANDLFDRRSAIYSDRVSYIHSTFMCTAETFLT